MTSTCNGKRRHQNEITARAAAMSHLGSGRGSEEALWVYFCGQCSGWHLTKQPQADSPAVTSDNPFKEYYK